MATPNSLAKKRKKKSRRDAIMAKAMNGHDRPHCTYCGVPLSRKAWQAPRDAEVQFFTLDHIYPRTLGGCNDRRNLAACCFWCNQDRGDTPLDEFIASLGDRAVITIEEARRLMDQGMRVSGVEPLARST